MRNQQWLWIRATTTIFAAGWAVWAVAITLLKAGRFLRALGEVMLFGLIWAALYVWVARRRRPTARRRP